MTNPLMPKATAVWLVENSSLTFDQIADFCGLHRLEVQGIADGEVAIGMVGLDPVAGGQLTQAELDRCERDASQRLQIVVKDLPSPSRRGKGPRYTPVTKRGDKPDAISWLVKNAPNLSDTQIGKLIGTTKTTILAVRNRTHESSQTIKPRSPVILGLCTQGELDEAMERARKRTGKPDPEPAVFEGDSP
jgi:hypothetical protein